MPFSFIDIETKQSQKIILLFFTLVSFYFIGILLLYSATELTILIELILHRSHYHYFKPETYSILPSPQTILILLGISLIAALAHWLFSIRKMVKRILYVIGAKPIDQEDRYHLLLKNIIDEVSVATGGKIIEPYVVSSRHLNAFALSDFSGRSIIGITEGLLTRANRRQLEGVIAHEVGHLVWGDCLLSTVSCSMAAVYAGLLRMMIPGQGQRNIPASFPMIFAAYIMSFLTLFLNTWISREREIRADATAVRLTRDPLGLAESLHLISKNWRGDFLPSDELSPIFIVNPHQRGLHESYGLFADLFTTHPPIRRRIDILLDMGHADYKILESDFKEKTKIQEEIPISTPEKEKMWYALSGKIWEGPFSLGELAMLKWLDPFTWITKKHDMQVKSAFEYKEINSMLRGRLSYDLTVYGCPFCKQDLERVYYEGVPIWRCISCQGRLVKKDQLSRIIVREEIDFSEHVRETAKQMRFASIKQKGKYIAGSPSTLRCPSCGNIMSRTFYNALLPYHMEIDICQYCSLCWLDRDELEVIQYLTQGFI